MTSEVIGKPLDSIRVIFLQPITQYIVTITSIISFLVIFEVVYDTLLPANSTWIKFLSDADKQLVINFIEWFGVLFGFLLPMILVRVWEQFDIIDNVFDREADAIKALAGDMSLLHIQDRKFSLNVLESLHEYSKNVVRFINGEISSEDELKEGNKLLAEIRKFYLKVFRQSPRETKESDALVSELLTQLNNIIDHRGDRISLSTQRLFESLKIIAVVTSIVWLVPFYFLYFQDRSGGVLQLGIFGWLLVISVTFLVIMILTFIDDLDKPFDGDWKVNVSSWKNLIIDIDRELEILRTSKPKSRKMKKFRAKKSRFT